MPTPTQQVSVEWMNEWMNEWESVKIHTSKLSSLTSFTDEEIQPFSLKRGKREVANANSTTLAVSGVLDLDVIYSNDNSGGVVSKGSIKQMSFSPGEFTQPSNQFQI